ncbi:MAG TPA: hypothetical protein VJI32_01785 [Candidatus Nanoarchaeia archaeon]|nr:hypothetical protein [Candidatus Nanoarchaeia archaeon]
MPSLQSGNLVPEILQLRSQGLTDNLIAQELQNRGYVQAQIDQAMMHADSANGPSYSAPSPSYPQPRMPAPSAEDSNIYERIEEITESMIDEKWDELIAEVKKIIEWKDKIEEKQNKIINDVQKLKEDFTVLHQGVLGKLEDYDGRMRDVGVELKAVGKVFKDVIPEFVENVKELKGITERQKK